MMTTTSPALRVAEILDAYRVIPRLWLIGYGALLWHVTDWFMRLPEPSGAQAALVSTVWGASAVISGWYFQTGRQW
jgi:hypothetical protein